MFNLFDIMQSANGGKAFDKLGNQFGIRPEQAQQAVEAVLPAISLGLQQQAQSIEGWQKILSTLGQSQNSAEFIDSDGDGIPDHLESEGNGALGAMFGGPEMAQAVANNAAQFAGLPASMMQQMLPMIAAMVAGGLLKGATSNGLGGLIGQMMQGGQGGALGGAMGGGMLGNILGQMMGGQPQQTAPQNPMGGVFGNILGQMMGGGKPEPQPEADPATAGLDMLKGMFETGRQAQSGQMEIWQQILGQLGQKR